MATHQGRVPATDERRWTIGWCTGTLTVDADRLVLQGEPLATGRPRNPVVIARADVGTLVFRCGLFGAALQRETRAGFRSPVLRTKDPRPVLDDLRAHHWPIRARGWRKPR
ncbi:MAG: hypothetical protein ACTHN0_16690 [Aquihabitans sp.]